jgi:hypothetical protein
LRQRCELLVDATLVVAGYHRPNRVAWRVSRVRSQELRCSL